MHCECRRDNRRIAGVFITGLSGLCPDQCGGVLMAAQGFLLIATFNGAGASFRQRAGAAD